MVQVAVAKYFEPVPAQTDSNLLVRVSETR